MKISESGAYTSSSNPPTPTSCTDNETSERLVRPMGQKAAKKNAKAKAKEKATGTSGETSVAKVAHEYRDIQAKRVEVLQKLMEGQDKLVRAQEATARAKEKSAMNKRFEILLRDTSGMTEEQREDHKRICDIIRRELNDN